MLSIACVLKSGGVYGETYVRHLFDALQRNITIPFKFVCLNDFCIQSQIPLEYNLSGWWSKLELFKLCGKYIYIDLDSVILGNLDTLVNAVIKSQPQTFFMSKSFREYDKWSSNIMAWNGDFKFILNEGLKLDKFESYPKGDQTFIWETIERHGYKISPIQDYLQGIYSYRYDCIEGVPLDAKFISFHGKPKPHELLHLDVIKNNWLKK